MVVNGILFGEMQPVQYSENQSNSIATPPPATPHPYQPKDK